MVRTVRRTLLRSQLACNEMQASARTCGTETRSRQHDRKCRLSKSTNYYLILGPRDKAAPPICQQINKFPVKRVKNPAAPSSIFIFMFSSSTVSQSEAMFVQQGECSQNMLSEAFWTPNIVSSQFDEYFQLGSRRKVRPIKNQLGSSNTPN